MAVRLSAAAAHTRLHAPTPLRSHAPTTPSSTPPRLRTPTPPRLHPPTPPRFQGALGLATNLFNMVDGSLGATNPEEAGDGTVSRQELRKAFEGIPNLSSHSVEEFLFLFGLNHAGQIERD